MSAWRLLLAEIGYRKLSFALSAVAVLIAAALFVSGPIVVEGFQRTSQAELAAMVQRSNTEISALSQRMEEELAAMSAELERSVGEMRTVETRTRAELDRLQKETQRLMRDMGFNLLIVHRDTNMADFWSADFAVHDMPQEYVDRLARDPRLTLVRHLVATLQAKITWENRKVLLVGYLPEATQPHLPEKSPMGYTIRPGDAFLGHELGVGRKVGETIRIRVGEVERSFRIARILPEKGSKEDITIAVSLADAQALLGKPGRVNQILALGCRCEGDRLATIRKQLADVLPETRITEFRSIAIAREEQRALVEAQQAKILNQMREKIRAQEAALAQRRQFWQENLRQRRQALEADFLARQQELERQNHLAETLTATVTPLVVLAAGVWVGLLALANVRQRRTEIGVLRALGKPSAWIAALLLGKAALVGVLGAALGAAAGLGLAWWLCSSALGIASQTMSLRADLVAAAVVGAPIVSALASYLPTMLALAQDPALALREA